MTADRSRSVRAEFIGGCVKVFMGNPWQMDNELVAWRLPVCRAEASHVAARSRPACRSGQAGRSTARACRGATVPSVT
jgi:hypothetical protein